MHSLSHLFNSRNIYRPTVIIYTLLDTYIGAYLNYLYARKIVVGQCRKSFDFLYIQNGHTFV